MRFKHNHSFSLEIEKEDFLRHAVPLVEDIDEHIKKELYHTACGIIDGIMPAGMTWEHMFYASLKRDNKINLTKLGKRRFFLLSKLPDTFNQTK